MRSFPPEMASAVGREKAKCSRNKRKFRQDPPLQNQLGVEDSPSSNIPAGFIAASDAHGVEWESRSSEATGRKSPGVDSLLKDGEIGTSLASGKAIEASKFYQEHLKLMRWFTTRKGSQPGDTWIEGKSDHYRDGLKDSDGCEEKEDFDELEEDEWDDCTEGELEELLLKSLDSLYKEAICKIESRGYNADDALRAVLRQGRPYGGKDAVSNIVGNALDYLTGKKSEVDEPIRSFADLNELQRSGLKEMVHKLREVRPALNRGDAMWCLLMCDLNFRLACDPDDASSTQNLKDPIAEPASSLEQTKASIMDLSQSSSAKTSSKVKLPKASISAIPVESPLLIAKGGSQHPPILSSSSATTTPCLSLPPLPSVSVAKGSPPVISVNICSVSRSEGNTSANFEVSSNAEVSQSSSPPSDAAGIKPKEDRKQVPEGDNTPHSATSSLTSEQNQGSWDGELVRTISDASTPSFNSQESNADSCANAGEPLHQFEDPSLEMVDKKVTGETLLSASNHPPESAKQVEVCELPLTAGSWCPQKPPDAPTEVTNSHACSQGDVSGKSSDSSSAAGETASTSGKLGSGDAHTTKESAVSHVLNDSSSPSKNCSSADGATGAAENVQVGQIAKVVSEVVKEVSENMLSTKETLVIENGDMEDQRDDMIMKLLQRVRELETQIHERNEWAKQKVMQAVRKLTSDLQELKALRLEREEANRLKKEKQASEDSATKKQADLETALRKASGQADRANATVRKLEAENAELRAEMEAAKLSAAESLASCQDLTKRERKYAKRAQAWEKQKSKLQEELSDEKRKHAVLQQQLLQVKERQQQAEVRWRQEEKAKEEATLRADNERRAKEQAEAAAKRREESLRRKSESNYQRHRDDMQRLECEIAQLRTTAEAAQLATSRWGPGVAVTPHMMELSNMQSLKETNIRLHRELLALQEMSEGLARRDVRRDRECVMCMCEEMSVVFLPCAHQVVCIKCNELHEKQGMRDCPSCRTLILQRIRVFGVSS
ncbi:hypothetical protein Mapa_004352 [Marchantia paleacea]|nr:hypothetical protein Mapa_004352 [Marchantia paleacea]